MRTAVLPLLVLLAFAAPAGAQDFLAPLERLVEDLVPRTSPQPRPAPPAAPTEAQAEPQMRLGANPPPLPRPRPEGLEDNEQETAPQPDPADTEPDATRSDAEAAPSQTPSVSPASERIYQTACPALLSGRVVGEMVPPIAEGVCGERSPLRISAVRVNGKEVPFSSEVVTNCAMAGALADWVGEVDAYAQSALDSAIAEINSGTSMMCRTRNGGDAAFLSEHGFANALDVVGFDLEDGRVISVEGDWLPNSGPEGRLLRQAHGAACARFTTVLGPEANAEHADHLHLDLGCHGQSCTAQICE